MKLRIFGINERSMLESLPKTKLSAEWVDDETHRWIDIEDATADELKEVFAPYNLPASILTACLASERTARFISRSDAFYLEVPTHLGWDVYPKPYVSILYLPTTVISIHRDVVHSIEDVIDDLNEEVQLFERSASALLYHLLTSIGKKNLDAALDVRSEAEELAMELDRDPERIDPQQIAEMRRKISHHATVHDDHTYCAGVLRTVESKSLQFTGTSRLFNEQLHLAEMSGRMIAGAQSRVADLQGTYDATVQQKVENRLRMLTLLSAIFLPLTLISGIYGMNFTDLPGMGIPTGYLIVIGFMLATVIGMGLYLKRNGWFD